MKTLFKKLNKGSLLLTGLTIALIVGCSDKKDNNSNTRYVTSANGTCVDTQNGNNQVSYNLCPNNNTCSSGGYAMRGNGCYNTMTNAYYGPTCPTLCNGTTGGQCNGYYCSFQYGCGTCSTINGINNCTGYYLSPGAVSNPQVYCQ